LSCDGHLDNGDADDSKHVLNTLHHMIQWNGWAHFKNIICNLWCFGITCCTVQ
jgi:hypothetical protein